MRPYLEIKVVKVKKKKDEIIGSGVRIGDKLYRPYKTKKDKIYLKEFQKGNWVNGENLDKIKFPCFCSYRWGWAKDKFYGILCKDYVDNNSDKIYRLFDIDDQTNCVNCVTDLTSLKDLIKEYDIKILKAKIILFEEE